MQVGLTRDVPCLSCFLDMTGHGGNIYRFSEEYAIPERRIIDFSSSINPLGISKAISCELQGSLKYLSSYPDLDTMKLKRRLSELHDIVPESLICGNGSTELIYLVVRALRPEKCLIPAPTFSEYEKAVIIS
ncbi:MAG: aminotransferase class I/II-fold pyridoxal phosphate-dependent enzyme, partial [Nitrospirota bacterium]